MEFCSEVKTMEELLEQSKIKIENCPKPILIPVTHYGFSNKENVTEPSVLQSTVFAAASLLNVRDEKGNYKRVFDDEYVHKECGSGKFFFSWKENPECDALHRVNIGKCRFKREVETTLRSWDEEKIWVYENQANLMRLTAFLALTLCRAVSKNETQMMSVFRSRTYRLSLSDCVEWELDQPFSSPCEGCLEKCKEHLGNGILNTFFAIVVRRWVMAEKANTQEEEIKFILHESLLESTECHGMGVIKLLLSVMKYTGRTFEDLMTVICVVATDVLDYTDWQFLVHFYREYLADKSPPYSLPWARLVDNDYFRNCSSKESPYVAATLTAIIEKAEGPGIWKAEWIKRIRASPYFLLIGQKLGHIVREILKPTDLKKKENQGVEKKNRDSEKESLDLVKEIAAEGQNKEEKKQYMEQENQDLDKVKEIQDTKKENQDVEKENHDAKHESQDSEKENHDTEQESQDMEQNNQDLDKIKKIQNTKKQSENLIIENDDLVNKSKEMEKESQDLIKESQNFAEENESMEIENQVLEPETQDVKKKMQDLVQEPKDMEKESQDLLKNQALIKENEPMQGKIQDMRLENQDMETENLDFVKEDGYLKTEDHDLEIENEDKKQANENLEAIIQDSVMQTLVMAIQKSVKGNEDLEIEDQDIEQKNEDMKKADKNLETIIQDLVKKNQVLAKKKDYLQAKILEMKIENQNMEKEISHLVKASQNLVKENGDLKMKNQDIEMVSKYSSLK